MTHLYRRQPPRGTKVAGSSPMGKGITAHFLFNGTFASAVRGKSGNPVATGGPVIRSGPDGQYAYGNGSGKIVTDLLPSALGIAGSSPRTIITEFFQGDSNVKASVFSLGDSSARPRSQMTLEIATSYRVIRLSMFTTDISYQPWTQSGTSARIFLAITYDGNVTLTFRSWARLNTGLVVFNTQTTTLPGPLNTGDTVPLNLMGGGTYNFPSMEGGLYHLSIYGGRCLSPAEIDKLYADRHQVLAAPREFPYAALAASTPPADMSLAGSVVARSTTSGALTTAIQISGFTSGAAAVAGALSTAIPLSGAAAAGPAVAGSLATQIALAGACRASASAAGTLTSVEAPVVRVDVSKIHPSRVVVFEGSGSRVTPFEGSGSRVTPFEGSGSRITRFE